ncbi:MFS transporter [Lacticaseibacillus suihuaensis]
MKNLYQLLAVRLLINLADSLFYVVTLWNVTQAADTLTTGALVALFALPDVLAVFIGPLIDRFEPRRLLVVASGLQLVIQLVRLATLTPFNLPLTYALALSSTLASSLTYPLEDVLIPRLAPANRLVFANSLFAVAYKTVDTAFNAVSGLLLSALSFFALYAADLGVFALVFVPLLAFRFHRGPVTAVPLSAKAYRTELAAGWRYLIGSPLLRALTWPLVAMNAATALASVAMPYFSQEFARPKLVFGLFTTAEGVGGMLGALAVTAIARRAGVGRLISWLLVGEGAAWLLAVMVHQVAATAALLALSSALGSVSNTLYAGLYQVLPDATLLGRVNTTVDSLITVAMPAGSLLGGWVLAGIGARWGMALLGLSLIGGAITYWLSRPVMALPKMSAVRPLPRRG